MAYTKIESLFAELSPYSAAGRQERQMERERLSEAAIPGLAEGMHSDGDGLCLRVRRHRPRNGKAETVSRQWFFIFRRRGKRTELGLGGYGDGTGKVSLAAARAKAEAIRARLAEGDYPAGGRERRDTRPGAVVRPKH